MTANITESIVNEYFNYTADDDIDSKRNQKIVLAVLLSIVVVIVILGNTLVILAVLTTRRLRTVTNCFVMSLALADWFVGTCVMPPAVAYALMGSWELGWIFCDIWVSLDILLCTASILSLCAISIDRYLSVTQPLTYSKRRRSKRLASGMILIVWIISALITCPPMFGWYERGRHEGTTCRYNRNTGYVIFSAMGSFFIPMLVMLYVYTRISHVVAKRHDQLKNIDQRSNELIMCNREEFDADEESSEGENMSFKSYRSQTEDKSIQEVRSVQLKISKSIPSSTIHSFDKGKELKTALQESHEPRSTFKISFKSGILRSNPVTRVSHLRIETKTSKTLSIVMGGFIACWLPFFVFYLLTPFIPSSDVTALIMTYLTWLGWFNSGINPFIYAFHSQDFRRAFWRLTLKHFIKKKRADVICSKCCIS